MPQIKTRGVNVSSTEQPRKIARSLTGFADSFMGPLSSVGHASELKREVVVEGGGHKMESRREAITQGLGNFAKSVDSFVGSMWLGANESFAEALQSQQVPQTTRLIQLGVEVAGLVH